MNMDELFDVKLVFKALPSFPIKDPENPTHTASIFHHEPRKCVCEPGDGNDGHTH